MADPSVYPWWKNGAGISACELLPAEVERTHWAEKARSRVPFRFLGESNSYSGPVSSGHRIGPGQLDRPCPWGKAPSPCASGRPKHPGHDDRRYRCRGDDVDGGPAVPPPRSILADTIRVAAGAPIATFLTPGSALPRVERWRITHRNGQRRAIRTSFWNSLHALH